LTTPDFFLGGGYASISILWDTVMAALSDERLDKRRISDLVETFKILNGFYNINKGLFFD